MPWTLCASVFIHIRKTGTKTVATSWVLVMVKEVYSCAVLNTVPATQ